MPARLKNLSHSFAIRLVTAQCALACLFLLGFAPRVSAQMQFDGLASVVQISGETLAGQNHSVADPAGNLYISDPVNNQVLKVTAEGVGSVLIPSSTLINGTAMSGPAGLALDNTGNLYVADTYNDRIVFLPPGGTPTLLAISVANVVQPTNLAVDAAGNVYVSMFANQGIYEISPPNGNVTVVATAPYTLSNPQGLAVDTTGALYIADTGNARVLKEVGGNATLIGTGSISLGLPVGVTVDDLFNIYVADASNSQIVALPAAGMPYVLNTGGLTLSAPVGVSFDGQPNAYIMDQGNNRIVEIENTSVNFGQVTVGTGPGVTIGLNFTIQPGTQVGGTSIQTSGSPTADFTIQRTTCTYGTAVSSCTIHITFLPETPGVRTAILKIGGQSANTLVTVPLAGKGVGPVIAFTPGILSTVAGTYGEYGAPSGPGNFYLADYALLEEPRDVVLDGAGDFYFVDYGNYAIRKVTPAGYITTVVGGNGPGTLFSNPANGDGGQATSANIVPLWGLALDAAGNIYDADYGWDQIREDTVSTKIINGFAGYWNYYYGRNGYSGDNGPATDATLTNPWGVVVDGNGNVIFSDYGNQVVRKVAPDGIITTIAGNYTLGYGYSGDNKPATQAQLEGPEGLAVDGAGDMYIADTFNNVIREVTPDGIIHTIAGNHAAGPGYSGDNGPATSAQLDSPSGLTLDGGGNLYIADYGNNAIRMVTPGGTISTVAVLGPCNPPNSTQTCYTGSVPGVHDRTSPGAGTLTFQPYGIAATPGGNLFFSDEAGNVIDKVDVSDPPSLTFAAVPLGQSTSQQDVTIQNLGTANLVISQISISGEFTFGTDTTCNLTSTETLAPEASCVLGIAFSPLAYGSFPGSVTISDNSQGTNGDTKTIPLSGSEPAPPPAPAVLTTPTPGSVLTNTSQAFSWTAGVSVTAYWFNVGTAAAGANAKNIFNSGPIQALTETVNLSSLTVGETIYATLYSEINGTWEPAVYTYTYGTPVPATLASPVAPGPLSTASNTFTWAASPGVTDYWFNLGTAPSGANAKNIFNSGSTTALSETVNLSSVATVGETIYATLYSYIGGTWVPETYTFHVGTPTPATLASPVAPGPLSTSSNTFTWAASPGVTHYWFNLGTASSGANAKNIFNSGSTTALSETVDLSTVTTPGETIYATLYSYINGSWVAEVYTFTVQ